MTDILSYIGPLDGDSWENLCNKCYRLHYNAEHYSEIPAAYGGDAGIEGFTTTGIVTQCYCPEKSFSDNELYEHLRDKMTTDIGKLLSPSYRERLKKLGVPPIHEWHFVIPYYKDGRILEHAETKRQEVLKKKEESPQDFDCIAPDFRIIVKCADNYRIELTQLIRNSLTDVKLNLAIHHAQSPNWNDCDSIKVSNIKRKVRAIMGNIDDSNKEDYDYLVNLYSKFYIRGLELMQTLRTSFTEVYEDIFSLEQAYQEQVSMQTRLNTDKTINKQLFDQILQDFENKLIAQVKYLDTASIMELKNDLISGWLADCSMQFRE